MNKFWQFLQDEHGKFSSMRLGFLIAIIPVMLIWIYLSVSSHSMMDIPMGVYSLIGILATGKVSQIWVTKHYNKNKKVKQKEYCDGIFSHLLETVKNFIPFLRKK